MLSGIPGVGKAVGFLTGNMSPDAPTLKEAKLLPETKKLVKSRVSESLLPGEKFTEQYVGEATPHLQEIGQSFLPSKIQAGQQASIFEEAIRNRAQKKYQTGMSDLTRQLKLQAPAVQGGRVAETTGFVRNDTLYALDFARKLQTAADNRAFARNQAISNILGTAGMAIGGAIGGASGAQLGRTIGFKAAQAGSPGQMSYIGE